MRIATDAFDAQPVLLHGREVRAPGDEGDVRPGMRQRGPEAAADAARSDYCDAHETLPSRIVPTLTATMVGRPASRRKQ